jgi:hypothetical protein
MTVIQGLKNITDYVDEQEAKFQERKAGGGRKSTWFKIADRQSVKVAFLQEMDDESANYSEKNGLGVLAVEHQNPANFKRKILCTMNTEGACFGCEKHQEDFKAGWGKRNRLYINVLVDNGNDDPFVAILAQTTGPKSITPTFLEYARDDETVSDKWFTIKRTGSEQQDTSYTIRAGKEHGLNVEDYELFDLTKVLNDVPYAQQEAHLFVGDTSQPAPAEAAAKPASDSEEW